jgi:hypothetical protein
LGFFIFSNRRFCTKGAREGSWILTKTWGLGINFCQSKKKKDNKKPNFRWVDGDPDRIRTCDRLLRRQLLYPTELRNQKMKGQLSLSLFVGVAGFEPTTSCSQSRRDTGLRYTPSGVQKYKSFMPSKTFHFYFLIFFYIQ